MKWNISRLILDSFFSPVLSKAFECAKNNYFLLLWEFGAKIQKQPQIKGTLMKI